MGDEVGQAIAVARGGAAGAVDTVRLDYEGRFLRRKRLIAVSGASIMVDLPETVSLEDGDALLLADGRRVAVEASAEPLLAVTGPDLARLAWHIGNRHTPCRIEAERLLIRADPVLASMLLKLGAHVAPVDAPFCPEGGAYGHGRTLGHSHGAAEGGAYQHHDHG